jgi:hypothetical protein
MCDEIEVDVELEGFKDMALAAGYPKSWEELSEDRPRWNWKDLRDTWLLTHHHNQETAIAYCELYPCHAQWPLLYLAEETKKRKRSIPTSQESDYDE